jgi:hypothetical protein
MLNEAILSSESTPLGDVEDDMTVQTTTTTKRNKSSDYIGVYYNATKKKFTGSTRKGKTKCHLGSYHLEVDAALAYDTGARALLGLDSDLNFATKADYESARAIELTKKVISLQFAGSIAEVESRIRGYVSKASTKSLSTVSVSASNAESASVDSVVSANIHPPATKNFSSNYTGVSLVKSSSKFRVQLRHNRKQRTIGHYDLAADAALAYDKTVNLLQEPSCTKNFSSMKQYEDARKKESVETGIVISRDEVQQYMTSKVNEAVAKASAVVVEPSSQIPSKQGRINALATMGQSEKKSAMHAATSTHLPLKKRSLDGTLDTADDNVVESEVTPAGLNRNNDNGVPRIVQVPSAMTMYADSSFEATISGRDDLQSSIEPPCILSAIDNSKLIKLNDDQTESLPFKAGCPVSFNWGTEGMSFSRGVVKNVYIDFTSRDVAYEIVPNNVNSVEFGVLNNVFSLDVLEAQPTIVVLEHDIAYGMNCPVHIMPPGDSNDGDGGAKTMVPAQVLFCRREQSRHNVVTVTATVYTVVININGRDSRVEDNVAAERLKYREIV